MTKLFLTCLAERRASSACGKAAKVAEKNRFTAENAEIAEKKQSLIQISRVIFPLRPQRSLRSSF